MSQEDLNEQFSEEFSMFQTSVIINIALLALVVYEHAITFEQEIEVVWRRRFSVYSILLLVNRYCILAYTVLGVVSNTVAIDCTIQAGITAGLMLALILDISLLASIRGFAISTWRYRIFISLFIFMFGIVPLGADLYIWSTETAMLSSFGGCGASSTIDPNVNLQLTRASRASTIVSDILLLAVTWYKICGTWRQTTQLEKRFSISHAMIRHGTLYFLVFLALNIGQLIVFEVTSVGFVAQFLLPITSILSSRFIINLRWIEYEQKYSLQTLSLPTIRQPNELTGSPDALLAPVSMVRSQNDELPPLLAPLAIPRLSLELPLVDDDPFKRLPSMVEIV